MATYRMRSIAKICLSFALGAGIAVSAFAAPPQVPTGAGQPRWLLPSGGAYPVIAPEEVVWLRVSIPRQRVYLMRGATVLYTMTASTGLDSPPDDATPRGTFFIQHERGAWFYSASEKEGARYWVSWKNHGEYLFHTVPMDRQGRIIPWEAEKLGSKASHGCIRLSVPDAKWLYETIPFGTRVVIGD